MPLKRRSAVRRKSSAAGARRPRSARQKPAAAESRYREFVARSSEAIFRFTLPEPIALDAPLDEQARRIAGEAVLAEANEAHARIYRNASANEELGLPIARFGGIDMNRRFAEAFVRSGYRLENVEWHETIAGEQCWFRGFVVGIIEDGRLAGWWGTQVDIGERKRNEQRLAESEERLRLAVEAGGVGVHDRNVRTGALYLSPRLKEILGYAPDAHIDHGRAMASFHPDDVALGTEAFRRACDPAGDGTIRIEQRILRPDGELRWIFHLGRVFLRDGKPERTLGFWVDITERKRAEAEVRKWADAFEHCAHGIAMGDPETHLVLACNPAFAQMLGRTAQEVAGTPIVEVYAAPERARARLRIEEADRTGRASFESAFQRADGSAFPVQVDLVSVRGGDGRPRYRIATVQDITRRRSVEQARDTLARAIENAAIEMVLCDPQDRVVLVSRAFREGNNERLKWLEPGTPYVDYLRQGLRRGSPVEAIGREEAWIAERLELRRRGGLSFEQHLREDRWMLVTDHRLSDGSTLTSGVDISGQKRAQRALAESERKLRDANAMLEMRVNVRTEELASVVRELEAFTYSVSHDLRAPLGAINGFAHLLNTQEGDRLTEDGRKLLQFVEANASRMAELLEGLLEFSRLGRGAVARQPVSMDALAREVLREQQAADKAEIRLEHLPDCVGDALLLKQVWANLIGNALKYSHGRAPAVIEIGCAGYPPAYHVRDNGAGFDMRHADKLFGVFERLHNESEFEGTGLGLAIVERIVRRHGGRVWAESRPGEGATFYFTLEA